MGRLTPVDLTFLALENSRRNVHMAAYQVFRKPGAQRDAFVPRVLRTFRDSEVAKPFNQRLKWLSGGLASWETVEPDLQYHVRYLAVPAPGRMAEFYEIISFLNGNQLDRSRPLWECYIIDGLEDERFAVYYKIHHALIDGGGALALLERSLDTSARSRAIRPVWAPGEPAPRKRRQHRSDGSRLGDLLKRAGSAPRSMLEAGLQLADLGAQNLRLKPQQGSLTFNARKTLFNELPTSSERRYANCELPLEQLQAVGRATDTTVNDVAMTIIDHALNRYLEEREQAADRPLVTMMAMSFRSEEHGAGGNQVSAELVPLGEPGADLRERLQQVHESTSRIKESSSRIPPAVRQLYTLVIFGAGTLPEFSSAFRDLPNTNANLIISNMIGPRRQLYLGGAPMVAFHGLPIVPPGCGLNVTFATVNETICLAVGAAPEAVDDPYRITCLIGDALEELAGQTLSGSARKRGKKAGGAGKRASRAKRGPAKRGAAGKKA